MDLIIGFVGAQGANNNPSHFSIPPLPVSSHRSPPLHHRVPRDAPGLRQLFDFFSEDGLTIPAADFKRFTGRLSEDLSARVPSDGQISFEAFTQVCSGLLASHASGGGGGGRGGMGLEGRGSFFSGPTQTTPSRLFFLLPSPLVCIQTHFSEIHSGLLLHYAQQPKTVKFKMVKF